MWHVQPALEETLTQIVVHVLKATLVTLLQVAAKQLVQLIIMYQLMGLQPV